MYMQRRVILFVDFQYHRSSCQATYQNNDFIVKDAKITISYTKLGKTHVLSVKRAKYIC